MATTEEAPAARSALAEPTTPIGGGWLTSWTVALSGTYAAYFAVAQVVLPKQADLVAGASGKVALIAVATAVQSIVSIVAVLAVGALSDRTTARRGRRQVWVLAGAAITAVGFVAQAFMTDEFGVVATWGLSNVGISMVIGAAFATVPDDVPVTQRAWVSAFFGIAVSGGPLVGIALVSLVVLDVAPGFVVLGLLALLCALPFAFGTRGRRLLPAERPAFSLRALTTEIVRPLRHADFAWAFSGRFFIQLSNALAQVFLFFYLQDFLHHPDPELGTFILVLIYTVAVVVAALPVGRISDRTQRRKRMVVISSVLQGGAGLIFAFLPFFEATMIGTVILGVGYGAYAAVDQALITQVLPSAEDRGRDLGVINIANVLPYALAGVFGGIVINSFGYPTLMVLVLVTGLIAALTVQPIKSVR
ncbi:MFS transporter [Pseudonocardia sp. CA-107938]|uniref:MFS transporter n=1 Tax=Pseudonocardia sp. CA-107938 TaxID=3240021 RepID=UPI003D91F7DC